MLNIFGLCSLLLFCCIVHLFCSSNSWKIPIIPRLSTIRRYGHKFNLQHLKEKASKYQIPQDKILEFVFEESKAEKEMVMEKVRAMAEIDYNHKLNNVKSAAHRQLSHMSLRYHLEKFLQQFHLQLMNGNSDVAKEAYKARKEHRISEKVLNGAKLLSFPRMTDLNKLLLDSEIRAAFWNFMGFPSNLQLPTFPVSVLYGVVSEPMHEPGFNALFLPNNVDRILHDFCLAIAARNQVQVKLFNVEAAIAGEKALDVNS